ncbi:hypothetical protein [Ruania rhizosphaerae]|uniref:hypothetical protein n=1 Tax=Ruania rhizosphaerae TaxID=1840413 RepID=UPI001356F3B5|nr:hypothetical protein [Ruania rhizosphaerae]
MSAGPVTRIQVTITVVDGPTSTNCRGQHFTVAQVTYEAFVLDGRAYRVVVVRGDRPGMNDTLYADDPLISQLPVAPTWFESGFAALKRSLTAAADA